MQEIKANSLGAAKEQSLTKEIFSDSFTLKQFIERSVVINWFNAPINEFVYNLLLAVNLWRLNTNSFLLV